MTVATTTETIHRLDPAHLVIGVNVRTDARLDQHLIDSIKECGVLEPIVAYVDEDGRHVVLMGQRRTRAAVEAGRPDVPVLVVPRPAESDRLVHQLAENDHRAGVRDVERIAAMGQMALLGMSAAQIAKQTATPRAKVDQALTIAHAPTALDGLTSEALTIDQALVLAEFEGDEEATAQLLATPKWNLRHTAQRIRDDRTRAALRAAEVARQEAAGVRVATDDDEQAHRLSDLTTADGEAIDPTEHIQCPGHCVYVEVVRANVYVDPDTGEVAPDQDAAEQAVHAVQDAAEAACDDEADADDADLVMPYAIEWRPVARAYPACLAPAAFGHSLPAGQAEQVEDGAAKEARRAERRRVVANNKAWEAAEVVRREWLATFAKRKTAPKGAAAYLAAAVAYDTHALSDTKRLGMVSDLLGVKQAPYGPSPAMGQQIAKATEGRALHIALVQALAAHEAGMDRTTWRSPQRMDRIYFQALKGWGYTLSEVEDETAQEPRK